MFTVCAAYSTRWRYGHQLEGSPVAAPIMAYLGAARRAIDAQHRGTRGRRRRAKLARAKGRVRGSIITLETPLESLHLLEEGVSLPPARERRR